MLSALEKQIYDQEGPLPIEDYALIGDCLSGALVGRSGSIDWLCWPRFDSDACFAALLGTPRNGRWRIAPADPTPRTTRSYRGDTLILETVFETREGSVVLIDAMPVGQEYSSIIRRVECRSGRVAMRFHMTLRFGYGAYAPWVVKLKGEHGINATAGPDRLTLRSDVPLRGEAQAHVAEFDMHAGEQVTFVLSYSPSYLPDRERINAGSALNDTESWWRNWASRCQYAGKWKEQVLRSLLTLKALTYAPTGGIIAALTTSLPEQLGGPRNWDYRFCWLRDATLTLIALIGGGYNEEAQAWRGWLLRSIAGDPEDLQIMYGITGERRLQEWEATWLPGYQGARPVRIGNAASGQRQLDVYGEVMDSASVSRSHGLAGDAHEYWPLQIALIGHLEAIWEEPDDGIWEVRGGRRNFTHSKVMVWVALDRCIRDAERFGFKAPLDVWKNLRAQVHAEVCAKGFNAGMNSFTQSYGSKELDASLLMIPKLGFLKPSDPRVLGTVHAIERDLLQDGFLARYRSESGADGLPAGEGVFCPVHSGLRTFMHSKVVITRRTKCSRGWSR